MALFKSGDIVFSTKANHIKLIVRRFADDVYYCRVHNHPESKEQFHYERDLRASWNPADINRQQ